MMKQPKPEVGDREWSDRAVTIAGVSFRLAMDPGIRDGDLAADTLTAVRIHDGERRVWHARELTTSGAMPPSGEEGFRLRELVESVIQLGFDDAWIQEIIAFVGRHGLLEGAGSD
jgi:hypothetical protein